MQPSEGGTFPGKNQRVSSAWQAPASLVDMQAVHWLPPLPLSEMGHVARQSDAVACAEME